MEARISLALLSAETLTLATRSGRSLHLSVSASSYVGAVFVVDEVSELMPPKLLEDRVVQTVLFPLV